MDQTTARWPMKPYPVAVTWVDHCHISPGEWMTVADAHDATPAVVMSVGLLLRKTKDALILAQTVGGGDAAGVFVILRSCIRKIKRL